MDSSYLVVYTTPYIEANKIFIVLIGTKYIPDVSRKSRMCYNGDYIMQMCGKRKTVAFLVVVA